MRNSRPLSLAVSIAAVASLAAIAAAAEPGEQCRSPIMPPAQQVYALDTSQWTDDMNPGFECAGADSTGPDVFFQFSGCADGTVTWTAKYEALVYVLAGSCDAGCDVKGTGRQGSLHFFGGWPPDEARYMNPIIVIDGLDGQADSITVAFDVDWWIPAIPRSWGDIKQRYR